MDDQTIELRRQRMWERVKELGILHSPEGRVRPKDAAILLGYKESSLKQMRHEERGPNFSPRGWMGSKVSYFIDSLADWNIEREFPQDRQ